MSAAPLTAHTGGTLTAPVTLALPVPLQTPTHQGPLPGAAAPDLPRRADRHRPLPVPDRVLAASQAVRTLVWVALAVWAYVATH